MKNVSLCTNLIEFFNNGGVGTSPELAEKFNTTETNLRMGINRLRSRGLSIDTIRDKSLSDRPLYKLSKTVVKCRNLKAIKFTKHVVKEPHQQVISITHEDVVEFTSGLVGVDCGQFISYDHRDYVVVVYK